jgi:hypothetical protein
LNEPPPSPPSRRIYSAVFLGVAWLVGFSAYRVIGTNTASAWGQSIWAAAGFGLMFMVGLLAVHARFRIPFWRSEWLLLILLPAVWLGLCWHAFWELTGKKNPNVPVYFFLIVAWLGYRNELNTALAAGRVRTWILTGVFCLTAFLSGALLLLWFPFGFEWIPIFLVSLIAMFGIDVPKAEAPRRRRPGVIAVAGVLAVLLAGGVTAWVLQGSATSESVQAFFGSADAQCALAWRYRASQDYARAAVLFERAAKSGSSRAQYDLAVLHYYGLGVQEDRSRAWLEAAAGQNYAPAVTLLGLLEKREGSPVKAMEHWQRAAGLGDPFGEYLLGTAYLDRTTWVANTEADAERNLVLALYWLEKARSDGVNPVGGLLPQVWSTVPEEAADRITATVFRSVKEGRAP